MFELESFIEECRQALREDTPRLAVQEVVRRAVSQPAAVESALGTPTQGHIEPLYHAQDLTIINLVWSPEMTLYPHDHRMWAVIGIYGGREDNTFFRRSGNALEQMGVKTLETSDTVALGESIIHSVRNPLTQLTAALHVYGGDFFNAPRSEWDPETQAERPYDIEHARRVFAEANQRAGLPG